MLQSFWRYYLRRNKWKIVGDYPYDVPKLVMAVAPHTSSKDFFLGLAVRSNLKLFHIKYLGKAELFKPPFGFFFRRLGGTPVDRSGSKNLVEQVVKQFNEADRFTLVLSPEGTRKKVDRLKSGFYHIALQAGVPILPIGFDAGHRKVVLGELFYPTGNIGADFQELLKFWGPMEGFEKEKGVGHLMEAS